MQAPHIYRPVNCFRSGTFLSSLYMSIMLALVAYHTGAPRADDAAIEDVRSTYTLAAWIGLGPAFLLGAIVAFWRARFLEVVVPERFRCVDDLYVIEPVWFLTGAVCRCSAVMRSCVPGLRLSPTCVVCGARHHSQQRA